MHDDDPRMAAAADTPERMPAQEKRRYGNYASSGGRLQAQIWTL